MNIKRLRTLLTKGSLPGLLLVLCYVTVRSYWKRQRSLCVVLLCISILAISLFISRLLHQSHDKSKKSSHIISTKARSTAPAKYSPELEKALLNAEKQLAENPDAPPIVGQRYAVHYELDEIKDKFSDIISKYGDIDRAYIGLGQCELQLGEYELSAAAWKRAESLSSHNSTAYQGLNEVLHLIKVKDALTRQLPRGQVVTNLRLFQPSSAKRYWAVIHGVIDHSYEEWNHVNDMRLTLFSDLPECRQVGESFALKDSRFGDLPFHDIDIYSLDITADGVPDVVIQEVSPGGDWTPSQMEGFAWRNGHLEKILQVLSSEMLSLEDINHDGTYQVRNNYEIGESMCHAEQPRWSDVYAYKNGQFVLANKNYPKAFDRWPGELRETLKKYPDDQNIKSILCLAYSLLGRKQDAAPLRKEAAAYFQHKLISTEDANIGVSAYKRCLKSYLSDIQR